MRILVLGRTGQLAQCLLRVADSSGAEIIALGRPDLDLTDVESIARAVDRVAPQAVINAAAYTAVDKAETEREQAFKVNANGAGAAAEATAEAGIPLIHVSTDYVFDGTKSVPYVEDDPTGPINVYGESKLAGERLARQGNPRHIIVRTAWVVSPFGTNFCKTMLRLAGERDSLRIVGDQDGSPTYAIDLATALYSMARQMGGAAKDDPRWGTYHLTNSGTATWAELAGATLAASVPYGGRQVPVQPIITAEYPTPARRPGNSRLDCNKAEKAFGIALPPWQDAIARCVAELLAKPV